MNRKFNYDYDPENDSLFLYDPKSKSRASIEMDDFIIDFNSKKELSGLEMLNASKFFKGLELEGMKFNKSLLKEIEKCNLGITPKNNFIMIQITLFFKSNKHLTTSAFVPQITERSPALAAA